MYTFTITKDKKNEIKHLLTHIPDPAKDTLVSKFKKQKQILAALQIIYPLCGSLYQMKSTCVLLLTIPRFEFQEPRGRTFFTECYENSFPSQLNNKNPSRLVSRARCKKLICLAMYLPDDVKESASERPQV